MRQHLAGDVTQGVYPVRIDATVSFFALDVDIRKSELTRARGQMNELRELWQRAATTAGRLLGACQALGLDGLLEDSGYKGRHVWFFLRRPESAESIHRLGSVLVRHLEPMLDPVTHLEYFPRQGQLSGKGLGNLIKLPLGIHLRNGRRSALLDDAGLPIDRPFERLRAVPLVSRAALFAALDRLNGAESSRPPDEGKPDASAAEVSEKQPPRPQQQPWGPADFDTDPELSAVLRGCAVLRSLRAKAEEEGNLEYPEQVALSFSLGHLTRGPEAVNYLFSRCARVSLSSRLKARYAGHPISCARIRQRIPAVTSRVDCNCVFTATADHYPTPVLHVAEAGIAPPVPAAPEGTAPESLDALFRRHARLERLRQRVDEDKAALSERMIAALRGEAGGRYVLPEGTLSLRESADGLHLVWTPGNAGSRAAGYA